MQTPQADNVAWRKSTYSSGQGGACVEIGATPDYVAIRDTKNRPQGHLTVPQATWRAFLKSITD